MVGPVEFKLPVREQRPLLRCRAEGDRGESLRILRPVDEIPGDPGRAGSIHVFERRLPPEQDRAFGHFRAQPRRLDRDRDRLDPNLVAEPRGPSPAIDECDGVAQGGIPARGGRDRVAEDQGLPSRYFGELFPGEGKNPPGLVQEVPAGEGVRQRTGLDDPEYLRPRRGHGTRSVAVPFRRGDFEHYLHPRLVRRQVGRGGGEAQQGRLRIGDPGARDEGKRQEGGGRRFPRPDGWSAASGRHGVRGCTGSGSGRGRCLPACCGRSPP